MADTDLEMMVAALSVDIRGLKRDMEKATGVFDKHTLSIERRAAKMKKTVDSQISGMARSIIAPMTAIGSVLGVREIMRYAESWQEAGNRLRMVGYAGGSVQTVLEGIYQAAQRSEQKLSPMVDTFARLAAVKGSLGANDAQIAQFSEALGLGAKVSGRSIEQSSGVVDQLMVAFQKNTFGSGGAGTKGGGRGFRAILADMPALAQAAADGLEAAGGSVIKLSSLMAAGTVSPKQFFNAVLKGMTTLKRAADADMGSIEESWNRFDNAMGRYIGTASGTVAASHAAAGGLDFLSNHLDDVANAATVLAMALAGAGAASLVTSIGKTKGALEALLMVITKNPWVFAAAVVAGLATAMYLYATSGRKVADALRDEQKAQEDLNKILNDAKKNGNKITADKLAEAGARRFNAKTALEEALALAKVAEQKAKSALPADFKEGMLAGLANAVPGAPQAGPAMVGGRTAYHQMLIDRAAEAKASVAKAQSDLTAFDKRWKESNLTVVNPPNQRSVVEDPKAAALAQRRAELLARVTAGAEAANADLVRATSEAEAELLRGTDGYYGALRAKIDADADAEILAVEAKRDSDLTAIRDMKKGWKEYGDAKAQIEKESTDKVAAINAKRNAELAGAGSELQEATKDLKDHVATLGLTQEAADRFVMAEKTEAIAAALEAGGHREAAAALREKLAAYQQWSTGAEAAETATSRAVSEADALRDAFSGIASGNPFDQVVRQLEQAIIQLEIIEPMMEGLFGKKGTTLSGGGGLLSGLFGESGSLGGLLKSIIPGFATGTNDAPGGLAWVGERGPELVNLPKHAQVMAARPSLAMASGMRSANTNVVLNHSSSPIIVQGSADQASIAAMNKIRANDRMRLKDDVEIIVRKMQRDRKLS